MTRKITEKQYSALQAAYDHLNARLFDGELPDVIITLNRKRGAAGYFSPERFVETETGEVVHEIALNPDTFTETVTAKKVLSTLAHEMTHLWQNEFGDKNPRKAYHNREWADKMEDIGLMPSSTGREGGSRTGQKMTHYVIEEGPFDWACEDLFMCAAPIMFTSVFLPLIPKAAKKNKIAYACEVCGQKAWAKPEARLVCGECHEGMEAEEE